MSEEEISKTSRDKVKDFVLLEAIKGFPTANWSVVSDKSETLRFQAIPSDDRPYLVQGFNLSNDRNENGLVGIFVNNVPLFRIINRDEEKDVFRVGNAISKVLRRQEQNELEDYFETIWREIVRA